MEQKMDEEEKFAFPIETSTFLERNLEIIKWQVRQGILSEAYKELDRSKK